MKEGLIIGGLIIVLIALIVVNGFRRKKMGQEQDQMRNDLKVGDKVMTDSGLIGEISEIYTQEDYKYFVLKSGGEINYGYFSVHANAVCYVFGKDKDNKSTNSKDVAEETKSESSTEATKTEPETEKTVEPSEIKIKSEEKTTGKTSSKTKKSKKKDK